MDVMICGDLNYFKVISSRSEYQPKQRNIIKSRMVISTAQKPGFHVQKR